MNNKHGQMSHTKGRHIVTLYHPKFPSIQVANRRYQTLYGAMMSAKNFGYSKSALKRCIRISCINIKNRNKINLY